MKKITLQPLDDGQKAVEIPVGKTVIGRSSLPGCGDKKVSRSHALLEVNDQGEVYLTPTHVNPCFYQPTAENPGVILKKDKPQKLENGDSFSLLPRAFRYKLCIEGDGLDQKEEKTEVTCPTKLDEKVNGIANEKEVKASDANAKDQIQLKEKSNGKDSVCESIKEVKEALPELPSSPKECPKKEESQDVEKSLVKQDAEMNGGDSQEPTKPSSETVTPAAPTPAVEESKNANLKDEQVVPESKKVQSKKVEDEEEEDEEDSRGSRSLPTWMADRASPQPEEKKRPKPTKHQHKEKATAKRKTESNSPEKKRKKKTERRKKDYSDDRAEHSQRQSSGRSSRTNRQTRQTISLDDFVASDDDEWQSDKSEPRHKKRRRSKRKDDESGSDWEVEHKKTKKVSHKFSSGSESGSDWGASSQKKKKTPKTKRRWSKRVNESDAVSEDEEDEDEKSSVTKSEKRYRCQYGKKCFRKNTSHLNEFSHPGDSDYDSAEHDAEEGKEDPTSENEDSDDLPECPYGTSCFRKNVQHKKEYKHTKKFRPQREVAKQAAGKKTTKDEDPNDKEEELLEDSDEYKPVNSGSEIENSQESAKSAKITKNKRMKRV